jgi:hypothetical protein
MARRYHFDLVCPRCGHQSPHEAASTAYPHVNCGDCLMDHTEVVEMRVHLAYPIPALTDDEATP